MLLLLARVGNNRHRLTVRSSQNNDFRDSDLTFTHSDLMRRANTACYAVSTSENESQLQTYVNHNFLAAPRCAEIGQGGCVRRVNLSLGQPKDSASLHFRCGTQSSVALCRQKQAGFELIWLRNSVSHRTHLACVASAPHDSFLILHDSVLTHVTLHEGHMQLGGVRTSRPKG